MCDQCVTRLLRLNKLVLKSQNYFCVMIYFHVPYFLSIALSQNSVVLEDLLNIINLI